MSTAVRGRRKTAAACGRQTVHLPREVTSARGRRHLFTGGPADARLGGFRRSWVSRGDRHASPVTKRRRRQRWQRLDGGTRAAPKTPARETHHRLKRRPRRENAAFPGLAHRPVQAVRCSLSRPLASNAANARRAGARGDEKATDRPHARRASTKRKLRKKHWEHTHASSARREVRVADVGRYASWSFVIGAPQGKPRAGT